jgi:hypothetical protein
VYGTSSYNINVNPHVCRGKRVIGVLHDVSLLTLIFLYFCVSFAWKVRSLVEESIKTCLKEMVCVVCKRVNQIGLGQTANVCVQSGGISRLPVKTPAGKFHKRSGTRYRVIWYLPYAAWRHNPVDRACDKRTSCNLVPALCCMASQPSRPCL